MKTESEQLLEEFLKRHAIAYQPISRQKYPTPDYLVHLANCTLAVEVTTVERPPEGDTGSGYTRTIGDAIRREIRDKSRQLRWAVQRDLPTLLLLHEVNRVGYSWFLEDHDFTTAMYGSYTITITRQTRMIGPIYNGRDAQLRPGANRDHFSALGRIMLDPQGNTVCTIFPNHYAARPIATNAWPSAFDVRAISIEFVDITQSPKLSD